MFKKVKKEIPAPTEKLWNDFIAGDMNSFLHIYEGHYDLLFAYGLKYLDKEEVEDSIQNLFLHILQNRNALCNVNDIKSYLFISLRNNMFKLLKKKHKKVSISENEFIILDEEAESNDGLIVEIINFFKKLSPRESQIVQMKYLEGYKNLEIAELLEIDYQTVRNISGSAIKKMRKIPYHS